MVAKPAFFSSELSKFPQFLVVHLPGFVGLQTFLVFHSLLYSQDTHKPKRDARLAPWGLKDVDNILALRRNQRNTYWPA